MKGEIVNISYIIEIELHFLEFYSFLIIEVMFFCLNGKKNDVSKKQHAIPKNANENMKVTVL